MDENGFLERMKEAEGVLYHVACGMLGAECDRQDALAETVMRCWESRDRLRREEYFTTWSVRILVNVCKDMYRGRKHEIDVAKMPERAAEGSAYEDVEMRMLMESLPEKERVICIMFYLDGMSSKDIARALGTTEGAVRFRLHQARKALRIELVDGKEEWV